MRYKVYKNPDFTTLGLTTGIRGCTHPGTLVCFVEGHVATQALPDPKLVDGKCPRCGYVADHVQAR